MVPNYESKLAILVISKLVNECSPGIPIQFHDQTFSLRIHDILIYTSSSQIFKNLGRVHFANLTVEGNQILECGGDGRAERFKS